MASSKSETSVSSNQPSTTTTQASSSLVKNESSIRTGEGENSGNDIGREVSTKNKEAGKNIKAKTFKSRATLDKELLEKSEQLDSLQREMDELQESLRRKQDEESSTEKLYEETKAELAKAQEELKNFADLEKRLSEENYSLRERIVQQGEEIERLKETKEEPVSSKNVSLEAPMHKILRKENVELHYEKEQLKTERDRLRQTVKEKKDQYDRMSGSLGDLESQLLKAKRELEDRVKASSRLEDRLTKTDRELNNCRERFAKLEKQNRRLSEHVKGEKPNESENDKNTLNKKEYYNNKHATFLQKKEEKLLDDRRKLETEVNKLSAKISELEGQMRNCRPEKGPTNERGSQTELGPCAEMTARSCNRRERSGVEESGGGTAAVRKCRGIVTSLGKFFEELIQNNQEIPAGGSRGRRTAIAARRANELLHELSVSIERIVNSKNGQRDDGGNEQRDDGGHVSGCTQQGTQTSGQGRKSEAKSKGTLWDRLSHAVANHEFVFDQLSPTTSNQDAEAVNDKEKEVKRAEIALEKLYKAGSTGASKQNESNANEKLTKEDASRLMDANRKQTEMVVRELLRKHHGEIRALVENAQQATPVPFATSGLCDTNEEGSGQNEASLAVQELDNFKTRTVKVQSLILKMQAVVDSAKNEKENVYCQLQVLEDELRQKEALLQAKGQELRRRHCKALEMEKSLNAQIQSLTEEKEKVGNENSRLHEVCRQKDLQILGKVQEVKALHKEIGEREKVHQHNLGRMRTKVEEAWNQYTSVKTRAEKRTAEFNEAAEKLKVSQGYLLDLWQTLKTVDNVVETNEKDEL